MAARKTIKVQELKRLINDMIKGSVNEYKEGRIALAVLLETVLMDTGNYHGFRYLNPDDMKDVQGTTVGINAVDYSKDPTMEEKFDGTDSTRVEYF